VARPDLDDDVVGLRPDCANDGVDDARIRQEMLTETLSRAVRRH
jgi:hypothetical protein